MRQEDGHGRSEGRHGQRAGERVTSPPWEKEPGGPGTEVCDGEHSAGEVVGAEECRAPAVALRKRLAGGGDREEREPVAHNAF